MKRRGLTPDGQTLEGLVAGANKSQQEFDKVEAGRVVVSGPDRYGDGRGAMIALWYTCCLVVALALQREQWEIIWNYIHQQQWWMFYSCNSSSSCSSPGLQGQEQS